MRSSNPNPHPLSPSLGIESGSRSGGAQVRMAGHSRAVEENEAAYGLNATRARPVSMVQVRHGWFRLATCVCHARHAENLMRSLGRAPRSGHKVGSPPPPAQQATARRVCGPSWFFSFGFFCAWSPWRTSTARPSSLVSTARIRDQLYRRRDHSVSPSRRTTASTPLSRLIWSGVDAVVRRVSACLLHACMLAIGEIADKLRRNCPTAILILISYLGNRDGVTGR
jgi:hypothetical protein